MTDSEQPRIYLSTPAEIPLESFPDQLARVLDRVEVACLRLALSSNDEEAVIAAGDALREAAHARDVPLVIERHARIVERLGLDGVHLTDGARSVRSARKDLGADAIVGAFCGASRHDGMTAAEAGADYVSFGPVAETPLGDGQVAERDLFAWWSEIIERPVVAEGGLDAKRIAHLAPVVDFLGIGPEIWGADDPAEELLAITAALR